MGRTQPQHGRTRDRHDRCGLVFLGLLPYLLAVVSGGLDAALGLPRFDWGVGNTIVGVLVFLVGLGFGVWSNWAEVTIGSGTPLPMLPTRHLVVQPPFTYCRNPMGLGAILIYAGVAIWLGSLSAVVLVAGFAGAFVLYVKLVEERELEARFGAEYVAYKQTTPFLLPRPPRGRGRR